MGSDLSTLVLEHPMIIEFKRAAIAKLVTSVSIAITLSACGGSDNDSSSGPSAESTPTPTPTASPQNPDNPAPTVTPTPTPTASPDPSATPTPTSTPTPTVTPQPTATPEPSAVSFVQFENIPRCVEMPTPDNNNVCPQRPAADSFNIIRQYPNDFSNRVPVHEAIAVRFGQKVSQAESELGNFLTLTETDTGVSIAGKATHASDNTLIFTPDEDLKFSTKYTFTIANGLVSDQGETFAGDSWQFATLFDVGSTKGDVISRCGLGKDLLYLGWVNYTRRLEAGSACAQFGFTAQEPLAFSCSLRVASALAVFSKSRSLTPGGGFNANFDYQAALEEEPADYDAESFDVYNAVGVNSLSNIDEVFSRNLDNSSCETLMNSDFTELGGSGRGVDSFPPNTYYFHEVILAQPK